MAGRHSWSTLRDVELTPDARADLTTWAAARRDPAFVARERAAAARLDGAHDVGAYAEARRAVREELGLDPDAVPHDPPPEVTGRLADVRNAVGSARLAGLEPDAATVADMERVARGERTFEAAYAALFARIAAERQARRLR